MHSAVRRAQRMSLKINGPLVFLDASSGLFCVINYHALLVKHCYGSHNVNMLCFLAEQKLRDKLAAAAREKMTQVTQNTKDKSLQAERKRKAAMFVNMLKKKSTGPAIGEHHFPISYCMSAMRLIGLFSTSFVIQKPDLFPCV